MRSRSALLFGVGIGLLVGYVCGLQQGDPVLGGLLMVLWSITGYGFFTFPVNRSRKMLPGHWNLALSLLGVLIVVIPMNSPLFSGVDSLAGVGLLCGLFLAGTQIGILVTNRTKQSAT